MKLLFILIVSMLIFTFDAALLRFAHMSLSECLLILGCAICAMMVWVTAMDIFINRK